jgi:hypothetical protein
VIGIEIETVKKIVIDTSHPLEVVTMMKKIRILVLRNSQQKLEEVCLQVGLTVHVLVVVKAEKIAPEKTDYPPRDSEMVEQEREARIAQSKMEDQKKEFLQQNLVVL